ncbi:MAG: hypothetical protein JSU77_01125 [Fidelibacterota bacterium]|nr:MAG: hypothetical protein JSU77_01125 [Candidatus Neomarinimicrobiota bacterium]
MDLKEKLDLLWKYLLLALLVAVVIMFATRPCRHWASASHGYCGDPRGMDVRVEKKIVNGDTTTVVWVGGEKIEDVDEFLEGDMPIFKTKEGDVLKLNLHHPKKMKKIRIEKWDDEEEDEEEDD